MISKGSFFSEQFCDFQGIRCLQPSVFRGVNTARPWEAMGNELSSKLFALSHHHLISGMRLFIIRQGPCRLLAQRHKHSHLCQARLTW